MQKLYLIVFILTSFATAGVAQSDEWIEISSDDGVTVYRKNMAGSDVVSFRGETVIKAAPKDIFAILADNNLSNKWIPMVKEKRDLASISDRRRLEYIHIDMPWPLTDRYFINAAEVTFLPDGIIKAFVQSVENPQHEEPGKILGFLHYSEFLLTPIDDGTKTYIRIEVNSDPKGMIPKWLVNLAQATWPLDFFSGLEDQLVSRQQLVH